MTVHGLFRTTVKSIKLQSHSVSHFSHDGYAAPYANDNRQRQVKYIAEHIGRGTGTAKYDGVPGTRYNFPYNSYH